MLRPSAAKRHLGLLITQDDIEVIKLAEQLLSQMRFDTPATTEKREPEPYRDGE